MEKRSSLTSRSRSWATWGRVGGSLTLTPLDHPGLGNSDLDAVVVFHKQRDELADEARRGTRHRTTNDIHL